MHSPVPHPLGDSRTATAITAEASASGLHLQVTVNSRGARRYRKSRELTFGSVRIPYQQYRNAGGTYYVLFYYEAGVRKREARSSFASLKRRAQELATNIANGTTTMSAFTETDRARWKTVCENFDRSKTAPEVGSAIYTECVQILGGRCSPAEACRDYVARHPADIIERNIPQIVEELLAKRRLGGKWRRILAKMLERFSVRFAQGFDQVQARELDDWLDSLPGGLRTRRNYRDAVNSLAKFAQSRGYLPRDWSALDSVSDPEPPAVDVNLYTPDELVRLLNKAETYKAGRKLVPLIAITAFAGVRHGEMNEEKVQFLDWADFDWDAKQIYVQRGAAKTGKDRTVDMPDNLVEWLQPYRRPSGKVVTLVHSSSSFCRLRKRAGIEGPKRNALRKSFITYKLAASRSIDLVADQAGNSAGIIRKNYKRAGTTLRAAAERWFAIVPMRADVLPLFQWAKGR